LQASSKRQIEEVQAKIDSLLQDKQRLEKLKESLAKTIDETTVEIKAKDQRVKELMHKRTQKLIELEKVKNKLVSKEKELRELIKEITKFDEDFHSEIGSVLNESTLIHNESVLQELSMLDPRYRDGANHTVIGNVNMAAPHVVEQSDLAFGEDGEKLLDTNPRARRKTYSKSVMSTDQV
jgi:chromosome segregation ATPase